MRDPGAARPIVTMAEAQAFTRIETGEEEALIAGFIRSASDLCEAFLRQIVIERPFTEYVTANAEWQRLNAVPVRSISAVSNDGTALPSASYMTDIDSSGCGWIRVIDPAIKGVLEVSGTAGIASSQNNVPEAIRQGVLRLVAHLFASRDGPRGEIPAAVTAVWRPYRRVSVA